MFATTTIIRGFISPLRSQFLLFFSFIHPFIVVFSLSRRHRINVCSCDLCGLNTKRRALDQIERQMKNTTQSNGDSVCIKNRIDSTNNIDDDIRSTIGDNTNDDSVSIDDDNYRNRHSNINGNHRSIKCRFKNSIAF